jgi:hypothetical protein
MLTVSAKPTSSTPPLEAGLYPARCVQLIDLGEQMNELAGKLQRQVMLMFEIPSERISVNGEDKPRMISATYTASLSDKAKLRSVLESWRGKQFTEDELACFDLRNILNVVCSLSVIEKTSKTGNKYSSIGSISRVMKGIAVPPAETPILAFDLDEDDCLAKLATLPDWVQERVKQGETYKRLTDPSPDDLPDVDPDDTPFGDDA